MTNSTNLVMIPARMASTRLPDKPLADIAGLPMIVHVMHRAIEADVGRVVVATDTQQVLEVIQAHGGEAVMTRDDHASGSDRIWEAVNLIDAAGQFDTIINVQGDLPTIGKQPIRASLVPLENPAVDLATLATKIVVEEEKHDPNVVKLVGTPSAENVMRALYFTRTTAPYGDGPLYHHIGLYAWRRKSLQRFVSLPASPLELREKLEQLRALEDGMRIDAALVDTVPLGVDTPAHLERARAVLSQ
ncbi:MAG: 3-deoxy-manno-octulosonate cytidylyltransferase [Rhizobiaceae bacterium]|nr:3-deoxy-manno-octulosonate cytidylyltransferase [Rhizobiaceae bacterium]